MSRSLAFALSHALPIISAIPNPISAPIAIVLEEILAAVEQTKDNRHQLQLLFLRVCDILASLKVPQNFADQTLQASLESLLGDLEGIKNFVITERRKHFFRSMLRSDDIKLKIEELERNVWSSCFSFQNSALITANRKLDDLWDLIHKRDKEATSNEMLRVAQVKDQNDQLQRIQDALTALQKPQSDTNLLDALLDVVNVDPVVTMTAMMALLERHETGIIQLRGEEVSFLRAGLTRLRQQSDNATVAKIKPWTITSYEVERGFLIGTDTSSMIRAGRWLGKSVGILELKDAATVIRVVKMWKNIRSTRIQTFLAASTVDSPPFLVMEEAQFNIVDHVRTSTMQDFHVVISEIIWGLEYLHLQEPPIVHGELRTAVINVNRKGDIVLTLPGISVNDLAVSEDQREEIQSSLREWLAPEILGDPRLKRTTASDIFAFGRLVHKLLDSLNHKQAHHGGYKSLRKLAEECTHDDPSARPTIATVRSTFNTYHREKEHTDMIMAFPDVSELSAEQEAPFKNVNRWRVVPFAVTRPIIQDQDDDIAYLTTSPLSGKDERPLRKLGIEVECHDQGKEYTSAHPRDGAWAWVELALSRQGPHGKWHQVNLKKAFAGKSNGFMVEPTRYEILRCPFADDTPRVHRVNLDYKNPFVQEAKKGDKILVYPKARFPGWTITMYSAKVHVVTEY